MEESAEKVKFSKDNFFRFLSRFLPFVIGLYVFINPFPHKTAIENISFYLSLLILIVLIVFKKTRFPIKTPLSLPFFLFVFWAFVGLFFAFNRDNSIHDFYAHLVQYLIFFYMLVNCYADERRFTLLIWAVIVSTTIYAAETMIFDYVLMEHAITTKLGLYVADAYKGEIPSNLVSVPTLFALLLSLNQFSHTTKKNYRLVLTLCSCILFSATLATQARGTFMAIAVALPVILYVRNKKLLVVFIALLIFIVALMPIRDRMTIDYLRKDPRPATWLLYLEIVKEHPVVGMGFGMQTFFNDDLLAKYNARVPEKYRQPWLIYQPHNMLVDIAARTGAVGLMLWLFVLFTFARVGLRIIRQGKNKFIRDWGLCLMTAGIALFIQGMFENILSGPPVIILYSILGMMMILWRLNKQAEAGEHHPSSEPETSPAIP